MRYPSPTLDGFDALWAHPLRWFLRQLTAYLIVALVTAVLFVAGAGMYALLRPQQAVPIPLRKPELTIPNDKPAIPPPVPKEALIAQLQGKEIGAPILVQDQLYGVVTELRVDTQGNPRLVVIQLRDQANGPKTIMVPYDRINWHSGDVQTRFVQRHKDETIEGAVRTYWGAIESTKPEH